MQTGINYREQYARYQRYFKKLNQLYVQRPEVRTSLEILLSLLTISFFTVFALRPTFNTIAELFATIRTQREVKETLENKIVAIGRAQAVWSQQEGRLTLLEQSLPKHSATDAFLQQIEGLAASRNLTLSSFNLENALLVGSEKRARRKEKSDPLNIEDVVATKTSFSVTGDFASLIVFLKDSENLRRLVLVESFSFGQGRGLSGVLTLTISGRIPHYQTD